MQFRPLATAAAVLALAAPLTSCGFDYATDRAYTPANGANNLEGEVDVLSAVIVSAEEGSGTFIASFTNGDPDAEQTVTGLTGTEGVSITPAEFEPITIPAGGIVNLAEPPAGITLTGDFAAGSVVPLAVDFGNGERIPLNVRVVADDTGYWEGMDLS